MKALLKLMYNISIWMYGSIIQITRTSNRKAKAWVEGRKNMWTDLEKWDKSNCSKERIWIHCASSGEFLQGKPIIEALRIRFPSHLLILSFFSPSGYEQWKGFLGVDLVTYLPLDTPRNAQKFVGIVNPSLAFFIKNEFWFNILSALKVNSIPYFFVSSSLGNKKYLFFPYFIDVLKSARYFFVQDEASLKKLNFNGIHQATIAGDTRIDNVIQLSKEEFRLPMLEEVIHSYSMCVVYGSIWINDLKVIAEFINTSTDILHIIAPHDISSNNILSINKLCNYSGQVLSQSSQLNSNLLMVDSIGILNKLYRYADLVYIGGGFGAGIHNTLEPAVYGIPIIFGPRYKKFKEAHDFIEIGAAKSIKNMFEFKIGFQQLMDEKDNIRTMLAEYFNNNKESTKTIMSELKKLGYA
jgi:3-deoxy-D-manno-octulosonic-acid transferase